MTRSVHRFCPRCATPLILREEAGRPRQLCPAEGCGHVFYDNPLPVVAALVELEGQVVLARGRGWPAGMFGLITGFLERDEGPEQGVLRELKEELGLEGRVVSLIGVYPFAMRNELIVAYHVEARGEVALGDEIEEIKRIPPNKLRPWPMGTGLAVADWIARRTP
ncbi:MAG: NUDIX domain-containing protein [Polyangiaceae bacterium]|nr:NUDIX domain-containing protein [Polyangiaceae bacterium]